MVGVNEDVVLVSRPSTVIEGRRSVIDRECDGGRINDDVVDVHRDSGELNLHYCESVVSSLRDSLVPRAVKQTLCVDIPLTKASIAPPTRGVIRDTPVSIVDRHIGEHYTGGERRTDEHRPEHMQTDRRHIPGLYGGAGDTDDGRWSGQEP